MVTEHLTPPPPVSHTHTHTTSSRKFKGLKKGKNMPQKVITGKDSSLWSCSQHKTFLMVRFCSKIQTRLGEKKRTSHALLVTWGLVFSVPTLVQAQSFYEYFTHPLFGQSCTWHKWAGVWKCHWSGQNWFYHSPKFCFLHIFATIFPFWVMTKYFF